MKQGFWAHRKAIVSALIALLCLCAVSFHQSKHALSVSNYQITAFGDGEPVRIVQLSDLHNSVFGEQNQELIDTVKEQMPDLILMTGDMLNADERDVSIAMDLVARLSVVAPVYFAYGNHEAEHEQLHGTDITAMAENAGAVVLDRTCTDIEVKGQQLRLGGIYGYCLPGKYLSTGEARADECEYLAEFQTTERYTILMCHMPVCWLINGSLNEWDVDCVFSGHAHGGQVRLPFVGGLWAPDQGWFPGEEAGLYWSNDEQKVMVLSRGLGSTERIPRWNNLPDIVVVDLVSK